jgi:DNA polymerase-3 subunit alpha
VVPDLSNDPGKGPVQVSIAAQRCTPPVVDRLKDVLQAHPGTTAVHLKLLNGSRITTLKLDDGLRVTRTSALIGDLKALLGADCIAS